MSPALFGWLAVAVAGFGTALLASRRVASHATALVEATRLSPFVVGLLLLAVGTDIPEMVNSLIASAADHGDLNVGDSVGSALTQVTLVLGLLPFLTGRIAIDGKAIQAVGGLTVVALLLGVLLMGDGDLSRVDGMVLVGSWVLAILIARRLGTPDAAVEATPATGKRAIHVFASLGYLLVVGGGAALAVLAMISIAELLALPEYIVSFFGASLGTSLPELIVCVTAIRAGASGLAIGDAFGSSLADSALSLGIGPAFFPTMIDGTRAVRGSLYVAVAIALVTLLFVSGRWHNRKTGTILLALYAAAFVVLLRT